MKKNDHDTARAELEERWRAWVESEPRLDEDQLREALGFRLPPRRRSRVPVVLLAAAASVVLAFVAVRMWHLRDVGSRPPESRPAVVHRIDSNVVLFISKDTEPLYIMLADSSAGSGDRS